MNTVVEFGHLESPSGQLEVKEVFPVDMLRQEEHTLIANLRATIAAVNEKKIHIPADIVASVVKSSF